ncbi:Uncharacterized protein K02A2.6, partial [Toxocara canis]
DALELSKHPLPVPDDIFATLNGGRIFTKLDLSDAYLQAELDDESKKLCTINTHRGLYQYQRLPFGVKSAPGIFQSIMDKMLSELPFTAAYLDDNTIANGNMSEHKHHLYQVFNRIRNYGFHLRLDKCLFCKPSIKYLGFVIDQNGRRPNPAKISAIVNMPEPNDVAKLRSFLGMVNYYQSFVDNMRFIRQPLDDFLKKDAKWQLTERQKQSFHQLKSILQSDLLLTHSDRSSALSWQLMHPSMELEQLFSIACRMDPSRLLLTHLEPLHLLNRTTARLEMDPRRKRYQERPCHGGFGDPS